MYDEVAQPNYSSLSLDVEAVNDQSTYVLGSEKIRLMERKMKNEILCSAYSPAKVLQNELCLMKIGQSSQKIQSFKVESQHST